MHPEPIGVELRDLETWDHPAVLLKGGMIESANEAAIGVLGTDAIGARLLDRVVAQDRFEAARRLESHEHGAPVRMGLLTNEGVRLAETSWVPLRCEAGACALLTWRDVTRDERIQAWMASVPVRRALGVRRGQVKIWDRDINE